MNNAKNQRGLGRGLSALLADADIGTPSETPSPKVSESVPIEFLIANPDQPRQVFDPSELEELASSIGEKGVIQPILVRQIGKDQYQIVAGERRWRAASLAKLHKVPVIIREYTDNEVAEIALIENIQRSNLNPVEEARGYERLMTNGNTQEEVSKLTGKSRPHIANMLRILRLEPSLLPMLADGRLSFGHAKLLVTSDEQVQDANWVITNTASVRELETRLEARRNGTAQPPSAKSPNHSTPKDADTRQLEQELSANLGMKLHIDHKSDGKGKLSIRYKNLEQLDRICQLLGK